VPFIALMSDPSLTNLESMIGRLIIEKGLASSQEVEACLDQFINRKKDKPKGKTNINQESLSDLLIAKKVVTKRQLERLKPLIDDVKPTQKIPGYDIIRRLGEGAMAKVYLARQISLDRLVAIKVLPKKYSKNQEWIKRFYAEGKAAAKLNHPNIVGALDVGHAGEYHYFVMEYVDGWTAYDDVVGPHKYTEQQAIDVVLQTTRALEHAHKAKFIHRDVKPKNIMITKEGVAKLADMGLARAIDDEQVAEAESGKAFGTPYYISPEQIRGSRDIDFRADIYSLGATFYHLVTGKVPFDGPNPSSVMHKHLKDDLTPPDRVNPQITQGVCEVIEVCMAKDPDQRYSSTSDLLHDLECIARGEPPLQARQKFDLTSLQALLPNKATEELAKAPEPLASDKPPPLHLQPFFWMFVAAVGWLLAIVMTILVLIS
jgi:serine/threonine protein kinase